MTELAAPPRGSVVRTSPGRETDIELLLVDLAAHWRRTLLTAATIGLAFLAVAYLRPRDYASRTSFMPEQRDRINTANAFLGLASQLGVGIPGGNSTPQLYADLIRSTTIADTVLSMPVRQVEGGAPARVVTLASVLEHDARPGTPEWETSRLRLSSRTSAALNPRTNIIELQVRMPTAALAQAVAQRYVSALNSFNRESRQTSARLRRQFVEGRLREAQDSLRQSENTLEAFLQNNRTYQTPSLQFTYERLQRRVQSYQEVAVSLQREFENARLEEVNDQPLLTVVDAPSFPVRPESRHQSILLVAGLVIGLVASLLASLARVSAMRLLLDAPDTYARLAERLGRLPVIRRVFREAERTAGKLR